MISGAPIVVATASSPLEAQVWVDMLLDEGILATSVELGVHAALGGGGLMMPRVNVLVNRADIARARNVIAESGGVDALQAIPAEDSDSRPLKYIVFGVVAVVGFFLLLALMTGASR